VVTNPSGGLTLDANYDGTTNTALLASGNTLSVAATETLTLAVTFTPDGNQPYDNSATTTGVGVASSDTATDTDAADAAVPPLAPAIAVTKGLDEILDNGDGSFTAKYTLAVSNTGNEVLTNVQVTDSLTLAPSDFPTNAVGTVISTSAGLTQNNSFNGASNVNLLTGADSLAVGASENIVFWVRFTPDGIRDVANQATASGTGGASGTGTQEDSNTELATPTFSPLLSVEKSLIEVTDIGGGQFTAEYDIELANTGSEPLTNVQVTDAILVTPNNYPATATATITGLTGSAGLTQNPSYDGIMDTNLLAPGSNLPLTSFGTITVTVTFTPDGNQPYNNTVNGSADGSYTATEVTDDATAETVTPPLTPAIEITKTLNELTDNVDGTFTAKYTLEIENTGNEFLNGVQVTDALTTAPNDFPSNAVGSVITTSAGLTANGSYDGTNTTALLAGTDTLAVGAMETISLHVTFTPDRTGDFTNQASVSGISNAGSTTVTDDSESTTTTPALTPALSVEKTLDGAIVDNDDGTFTATYTVSVENTGNEPLMNLQLIDDLVTTPNNYPSGATVAITTSTGLSSNTGYDGITDANLLAGTDTLAVDGSGSITFTVTFTPDGNQPYNNTVNGSAEGSVSTTQVADDGTAAPVIPPLAPAIGIAKTLDDLLDNGDGTFTATYTVEVENTGNELLTGLQINDDLSANFPVGSTGTLVSTTAGLTGDFNYDGTTLTTLLDGTDSLAIDVTESLVVSVTFTPDRIGAFTNTASANATGVASTDPATSSDSVDATPTLGSGLEITKNLDSIVETSTPGTFISTFTVVVHNTGNEPLTGVQLTDDLAGFATANPTATVLSAINFAENNDYDGSSDTTLLLGTDTLGVGRSGSVTLAVTYTPPVGETQFTNQVLGSGTGELTNSVISENSDDPDTPGVDDDPTLSEPTFAPEMNATKALDSVTHIGGGVFEAAYTITVENTGNEQLNNVQIVDAISSGTSTFPTGSTAVVSAAPDLSATDTDYVVLSLDPNYDGTASTGLLVGTESLAIGEYGSVIVTVTFTPDGSQPYDNQATANAVGGNSGQSESDVSDDPTTLDPEDATTTEPVIEAILAVTKSLSSLVENTDGTFTATYAIEVANNGNEPLADLAVTDSLADYPTGFTFVATNPTSGLTLDTNYDGITNTALVTGVDTLAVGVTETILVAVTFTPDSELSYDNTAAGSATGTYTGTEVTDDGVAPLVTPTLTPELAITKTLGALVDNGDGSFTADYTLNISNTGNEAINALQVTDAVSLSPSSFPSNATGVALTASTGLSLNTGYDGVSDVNLLTGTDSFAVGASGTITLSVTYTPISADAVTNQATVSGTGNASGTEVETDSNSESATPTFSPAINVTKTLVEVTDIGGGQFTAEYEIAVENSGSENLTNVQVTDAITVTPNNFPTGSSASIISSSGFFANTNYNGVGDDALLATGNNLAIGVSGTITVAVTFTADANRPYSNTVNVTADGVFSGSNVTDSDTADADVTPIIIPAIEVVKTLVEVRSNGDGTFVSEYTLSVTNNGNEPLSAVQITDDLSDYPVGSTAELSTPSAGITPNSDYNGFGNTNVLNPTANLAVGVTESLTLEVTFTPDTTSYTNTATTFGLGTLSSGIANDTDSAINAIPPLTPEISLTKTHVETIRNGDLTNTSTFQIIVENTGTEALDNVQITDNLLAAPSSFPSGSTAQLVSVSNGHSANTGYDGVSSDTILASTISLAAGESVTAEITVSYLQDNTATYTNSASVIATPILSGGILNDADTATADPGEIKPDTFAEWQNNNPLGGENGPMDNPDGDRSPNLAEYAFCTHPETGFRLFPDDSTQNCGLMLQENAGSGNLDASYIRPTTTDVIYELMVSTDGETWTPTTVAPTTSTTTYGATLVTYEDVETLFGPEALLTVRATYVDPDGTHTVNSEVVGWQPHLMEQNCETFAFPYIDNCFYNGTATVTPATREVELNGSLAGTNFTDLLNSATKYAIEITEGPYEGHRFEVESFTDTALILAEDTDLCAGDPCNTSLTIPDFSGAKIALLSYPTINELFPPSVHLAGTNSSTADLLYFFNRATQSLETYYLLDDAAGDKWVTIGSAVDLGNTPVCPTDGIYVTRRSSAFTDLQYGAVRDWGMITPLKQGDNFIAAAHPLDASADDRLMLNSGFTGGADPALSDQFLLWNGDATVGDTGYDGYFYTQVGSFDQWTEVSDVMLTDETASPLFESDRSVFYRVRNSAGLPNYQIPTTITPPFVGTN